jgi:cell division protein FtsX
MGPRGLCLTAGPLLIVLGGYPLFFISCYAEMATQGLASQGVDGWPYWSTVLSRMFDFTSQNGWISLISGSIFLLGLGMLVTGIVMAGTASVRYFRRLDGS